MTLKDPTRNVTQLDDLTAMERMDATTRMKSIIPRKSMKRLSQPFLTNNHSLCIAHYISMSLYIQAHRPKYIVKFNRSRKLNILLRIKAGPFAIDAAMLSNIILPFILQTSRRPLTGLSRNLSLFPSHMHGLLLDLLMLWS
ncbi:hypothetical protein RvY_04988-2 [Ramazzottius varieornatus]|uniref:Uncharacterized protein n=1 Tax=Ramazzottius varieornatus TaxID=947166 RepID=A0A1D1UTH6_RAMVA|nr:hypothetical protein RvY_04988-2 [Ramazzottius varieornatus]